MSTWTRRRILAEGGRLAVAASAATQLLGRSTASAQQLKTVRATHFGGPYQVLGDIVAKPFADAKLGQVEYDIEISPTVLAKLQTQRGNPPFDVAMVSRSFGLRILKAGLFEKVAASDFSNASALIDGAVPAGGWGAAFMLDTFDIMIDTKQVKEPVTSWLDLWKPEFAGKLALPAAANGGAAYAFISCIVRAIGGTDWSDAVVREAFGRLKALKTSSRVFYPDSIQPTQLMDRGDISIAPQFGIRIANQTRTTPNVVKVTPKEGVAAVPYDLCITKGAQNIDLAKAYINFTLSKDVQDNILGKLLATPTRTGLVVPPDLGKIVTTDPAKIWFGDEEYAAAKQREWLDRYTREVQS